MIMFVHKKLLNWMAVGLMLFVCYSIVACSKGDDDDNNKEETPYYPSDDDTSVKVTKPEISTVVATTTTIDFDVTFKVVSEEEPSSVILYYGASGTSTPPSSYQTRACHWFNTVRGSNNRNSYYYKASKAGYPGGTRVFFYGVAKNSAGTAQTAVDYRIMKRSGY